MRLSPLRKFTRGYTGQKSVTLRSLPISLRDIMEAINSLQLLIDSDIKPKSSFEFNQFIRGRLFVMVDNFLTNYQIVEYRKEEIESIIKLCTTLILFVHKWLSLYPVWHKFVLML